MAHKKTIRDSIFLAELPETFNGKGWHGLGIPTQTFDRQTLEKVLFSHSLVPAGILLPNGLFHETGQRYAIANDDGLPLGGAVGKNWASPGNDELFDLFSEALTGSPYKLCSAMTLDNRLEFCLDAKGENLPMGSRTWSPFVGLRRLFGGQGKLSVSGHGTVIQCGNTSALFQREADAAENTVSRKNTGKLMANLDFVRASIEKTWGVAAQFAEAMSESENVKVKPETASRAFVGFLTDGKPLSTRTVNRTNRLVSLFKSGGGNRGETMADFVNALTDYYTHEHAGSVDSADSREDFLMKQFHASEFGSGARVKSEIVKAAFDFEKKAPRSGFISGLAKVGKASVDASETEFVSLLTV